MIIDSKELIINQLRTPDKKSVEFLPFWVNERDKCKHGLKIDNYFISGLLYFHLNYFKCQIDVPEDGRIIRKLHNPYLRDNEWLMDQYIQEAEKKKKGLLLVGSRRLAKSVIEASYITHRATFFQGTQNVIAGLNEPDIKIITNLCDEALVNLPTVFKKGGGGKLESNWKKEVTLGTKSINGEKEVWSSIPIRNLDGGKNTEALAGLSPFSMVIDEALEENSLLYTLDGEVCIKDIKVGNQIYGNDGKLTKVVDKIDPGIVDIYEFELSDGRKVKSSSNHIWKVYNTYLNKWEELTTDKIRDSYFYAKFDKRYNKQIKSLVYSLPVNSPIEYREKILNIDPYYMGLWLGDGSSTSNSIFSIDDEIIDYCVNYGTSVGLVNSIKTDINKGKGKFRVIRLHNNWKVYNPILDGFKKYNLFRNKHIPKDYLYGSIEQRLELLKGLMDTDGSCNKKGGLEFGSSFPQLAKDFMILLNGLGISFNYTIVNNSYVSKGEKKIGKDYWRFRLYTDLKIFKLPRKLKNYNLSINNNNSKKQQSYKERITIKNIEYVGKFQAYCIKVDNISKLFLTNNCIVTHNCGKGNWLDCFSAAIPSFSTPFGWRCSPLVTATGGSFEKGDDTKKVFEDPESYNFLSYEIPDEGNIKRAAFISGHYAHDFPKDDTPLNKFLKITDKEAPNLSKINIRVTNFERANRMIDEERAKAQSDKTLLLKLTMYHPRNTYEVFLSDSNNNFPIEDCKARQLWLRENYEPEYIELYREGGKVHSRYSNTRPIKKFPVKFADIKYLGIPPLCVYQTPDLFAPATAYVIGYDPYNEDQSSDKINSLGSITVKKRYYEVGDPFANRTVATWAGRCNSVSEFHELCLMVAEYYNAIEGCLPENEDKTLIQYFLLKRKGYFFAKALDLSKEINQTTKSQRIIGLSAATPNQRHYMRLLTEESKEEIETIDENGIIDFYIGVSREMDDMLLEEYIQYKGKDSSSRGIHDGNYDRIISNGLALTLLKYYDVNRPLDRFISSPKFIPQENRPITVPSFFGNLQPKQTSPFYKEVQKNSYTPKLKGFNF